MASMTYDKARRTAVLSFAKGRELRLSNVTEEQAKEFFERHAPEFERRDCVLHTDGTFEVRDGSQ